MEGLHVEVNLKSGKKFLDEFISNLFFEGSENAPKELYLSEISSFISNNEINNMNGIQNDEGFRDFISKKIRGDEFLKKCFAKYFNKEKVDKFFEETEPCRVKRIDVFFGVFCLYYDLEVGNENSVEETGVSNIDFYTDNKINMKNIEEKMTLKKAQEIYKNCKKYESHGKGYLDMNSNLTVYYGDESGVLIGRRDNFWFKNKKEKILSETFAAIEKSGEIIAVGNLQQDKEDRNKFYFLADGDNIDYELLKKGFKDTKANLVVFPKEGGKILTFEFKLNIKKIGEENSKSLCIDFGTCNTTVGSYGEDRKPELVEFFSGIDNDYHFSLPTIVYVKEINDGKPKYLFGYDAQKRIIECDYTPKATVFREIKRWMGDVNKEEELVDEYEYTASIRVKRKDIIRAYIDFIIKSAEAWFKCSFKTIHFTAPVKMKEKSLKVFNDMFKKKMICEEDNAIDEAVAVVYDYIERNIEESNQNVDTKMKKSTIFEKKIIDNIGNSPNLNLTLEQKKNINANIKKTFADDGKNEVTVIDCGGGTTDVAHCRYEWDCNNRKLNIVSQFENGSSCYAGNNITYRILQLLKIKIYKANWGTVDGEKANELVDDLLKDRNEIIGILDGKSDTKEGYDSVYSVWGEEYSKADKYIPTKFNSDTEDLSEDDVKYRKRNYYYLWEMAEKFKKRFFESDKIVELDFSVDKDVRIVIEDMEKYYLYFYCGGNYEKVNNPLKNVELNHKEIEHVIYADVYKLLKDVMPDDLGRGKFRLSGQSCNISLFQELLKEFIPGKNLSKKKFNRSDLKKSCILGAIKFRMDSEGGGISSTIENDTPTLNYIVRYMPVMKGSLIECLQQKDDKLCLEYVDLPESTQIVKFQIASRNNDFCREIEILLNGLGKFDNVNDEEQIVSKLQESTYSGTYDKEIKDIVDNVFNRGKNGHYNIILLPDKQEDGFNLYLLKKEGKVFKMSKYGKVIHYTDDSVEIFFDGKH